MAVARRKRGTARARRASRFRRDRRGVVSVVGTLLSLLVFFALFGVFITQYVPIWMNQNESQFTYQGQASIEQLKQYVDDQAIFGAPPSYGVPFTLSSQGIPLFAQPTQGSLAFLSGGCAGGFSLFASTWEPASLNACVFEHLGVWNNATGAGIQHQPFNISIATSYLVMQLPNRYYPSSSLYFANDAVVSAQTGGHQVMLVPSPLNISSNSGNTTVTASLVTLSGFPNAIATQGTKDVYVTHVSNQSYSSSGRFLKTTSSPAQALAFNVSFDIGTRNVCAWYSQVYSALNASGIKVAASAPLTSTPTAVLNVLKFTGTGLAGAIVLQSGLTTNFCADASGATYELALTVFNVNYLSAYSGVSQLSFSAAGL